MDAGPLRDVLTVGLGVLTGILSAAFGVGGAVISTPGVRLLGASALLAVGTTLPSILPSAVSGAVRYAREDLVDWRVARLTAPVGVVASIGGARLSRSVPGHGHWLMVLTAVILGYSAYRMWSSVAVDAEVAEPVVDAEAAAGDRGASHPTAPVAAPRGAVFAGIGLVAGGLSGLLGVGGGVVMVPAFTELVRLPLKAAIATSLVLVGVLAVPGTIAHALQDGIDWRFALFLAVGVVPGARIGAAAALRATDRRLRLVVSTFLAVIAVAYATGELVALVR